MDATERSMQSCVKKWASRGPEPAQMTIKAPTESYSYFDNGLNSGVWEFFYFSTKKFVLKS